MVILASKSPRRKELLKNLFDEFSIIPPNINEFDYREEDISRVKAEAIALLHPNDLIISADTLVIYKGQIFGKPQNEKEAYEMLKTLSNDYHLVTTYYTIMWKEKGIEITHHTDSKVYFNNLSDELINKYICTGSPFDKAGGYGIQDKEFNLVNHIEGSYYNVVGLPLEDLKEDLIKLGIKVK
jgi:septum formation protein